MLKVFKNPTIQIACLLVAWALVCLPNLGISSLWDIDEGNNAEAAYEMMESGNWIVPTYNYNLRVDKPALLYWLQIASYNTFGVNEFAARFPSALGGLFSLFATYALATIMFGASTGFFAGLILLAMPAWAGSAHFANPDSLLNACVAWSFFVFFKGYQNNNSTWLLWGGIITGIGMLAKGPIALALPLLIIVLFLLWERQPKRLLSIHLLSALFLFFLVAGPWYIWVGVETKFLWHKGFFFTHNLGRFSTAMENHSGPWFYYLLVIAIGSAPWSAFIGMTFLNTKKELFNTEPSSNTIYDRSAIRLLATWIAVVLIFFSISSTKLPNYILPLYPAIAILTARAMLAWKNETHAYPNWLPKTGMVLLVFIGIITSVAMILVSTQADISWIKGRKIPRLEQMAFIGLIPITCGIIALMLAAKKNRIATLALLCLGSIGFTGALGAWNGSNLNEIKAPKLLSQFLPEDHLTREIVIATHDWFQPSITFYCKRQINTLTSEEEVKQFLEQPIPAYVFMPEKKWDALKLNQPFKAKKIGQATDFYRNCNVVLLTNQY